MPWPFAAREVGILVCAIPGDKNHAQQNSYINAIRSLVSEDPALLDVVKVRLLARELPDDPDPQHQEALIALALGWAVLTPSLVLLARRWDGNRPAPPIALVDGVRHA